MGEIVFIDANIFLELLLDDAHSAQCEEFFQKLEMWQLDAKTSDFILYTCLLQLQHKSKSLDAMKNFLLFINKLSGLEILRPSLKEMHDALTVSEKYKLDFDDSLVVSCMFNNNIKTLISFDKDFDKVNLVTRKEPNQTKNI